MGMMYSVSGSSSLSDWATAAREGGRGYRAIAPSIPSSYYVDAWLVLDDREPVCVSGQWLSAMSDDLRKPFLKELGLPVTKRLVCRKGHETVGITDMRIVCTWKDCFSIEIMFDNGSVIDTPVNSMYLSEMNAGKTEISDTPPVQQPSTISSQLPPRFIVFDLETTGTNPNTDQICEIGAILVEDGRVVDSYESLARINGSMPSAAQDVHHISDADLIDAPHVADAVDGLLKFIGEGETLTGFNIKTFDIILLSRVANDFGMELRYESIIDILDYAKKAWPNLKRHKMDYLREHFYKELELSKEGHRSVTDCQDELAVLKAAISKINTGKPVLNDDSVRVPTAPNGRPSIRSRRSRVRSQRKKAKEFTPHTEDFDQSHPLYLKNVVISGDINPDEPIDSYNEAMQIICNLGGKPQDSVTMKTNVVVVGQNPGKTKLDTARRYRDEKGLPIEIISVAELMSMIGEKHV